MAMATRLQQGIGLVVALVLGISLPAAAVTVEGLYSAQVPVAGSQPQQLDQGYQEGLRRVLVRVSGSRDVFARDGVDELLADAESLLLSYQFLRGGGDTGDDNTATDQLRMTFGAVSVNKALAALDAPVWGANRPLTLAWIAVEDRGSRTLLVAGDGDDANAWRRAFNRAARERGLPLAYPPAQASADRRLLSEVWGQFMGSIREASSPVAHDFLAVARIARRGDGWEASWHLEGQQVDVTETLTAGDADTLAQGVVDAWADRLAARYAVAAGEVDDTAQVDLILEGIGSMTEYGSAQTALKRMNPVTSVGAVDVTPDRLTLQVGFSGELDQLRQYIALDGRFAEVSDSDTTRQPASAAPEPAAGRPAGEEQADTSEGVRVMPEGEAPEDSGQDQMFQYRPQAVNAETSGRTFESLYETLHYRWLGGTIADPAATED